jgi:hypothetical protein
VIMVTAPAAGPGPVTGSQPMVTPGPAADGDRDAELSHANKSFADHHVTGDPPRSSPSEGTDTHSRRHSECQ